MSQHNVSACWLHVVNNIWKFVLDVRPKEVCVQELVYIIFWKNRAE